MKKATLLIAATILAYTTVYSQNDVDSAVCRHLVESGQIDKAVNTTAKVKEDQFLKSTNYFYSKKPVIKVSDSMTLEPVIFGCHSSHAAKNLLVCLKINSNAVFYYYGNNKLLVDIEKIRQEILETIKPSLNDEDVAVLINYLSACYL